MLNLEFICDLKSKTVAYGAKEKECDFSVTSVTRIKVTNLFDLNTMLKKKPGGGEILPFLDKNGLITYQRKDTKQGTIGEGL